MQGIITKTKNIIGLAIIAAIMFAVPTESFAQRGYVDNCVPEVPLLSLTGFDGDYDSEWYPDAQILTPPASNGTKLLYVPVWIENEWEQPDCFDDENIDEFDADPITSFQFSILYHKGALKPVGLTTDHPEIFTELDRPGTSLDCDAKDWHLTFTADETPFWKDYIIPTVPAVDSLNGMRMRINGVSPNKPLPVHSGFNVLLYVIFEVVPRVGQPLTAGASFSPLIIHNDEIIYNDYDVTDEPPFLEYADYLDEIGNDYSNYYDVNYWANPKNTFYNVPQFQSVPFTPGLAGISNWALPNSETFPDPILPGMIYVSISDSPQFEFEVEGRPAPQIFENEVITAFGQELVTEYVLVDPITALACESNPQGDLPVREVILTNTQSETRIENVIIETSADWLEVQTNRDKGLNFLPQRTTKDIIRYVDNGTLDAGIATVLKEDADAPAGRIVLNITCDPSKVPTDPEFEGVYEGFVTVKSDNALNSPCRLRVTFHVFRAPQEGRGIAGSSCGVTLNVENSNNPVDRARLIFGTADRATDGVDPLFGEIEYETPLSGFGARFYLRDRDGNDLFDPNPAPDGLFDNAPNDENQESVSRDIRSDTNSVQSIDYYVGFNENGDDNYPITVSWDVRDFIDGAQYFIVDGEDGRVFPAVNMRTATPSSQDDNIRTFTIQDQAITHFIIEYTLPRSIDFLDNNGDPIIKEGWNFLSLPVSPVNSDWEAVYPNAINEPIYFVPDTYLSEDLLKVGRGYFVKYSEQVDVKFAGTSITEINRDRFPSGATRVFKGPNEEGGWTSIGGLSIPTCIDGISFEGNPGPDRDYTLKFGVWRYNTNRGYEEVSELLPGLGHFIKVNGDGNYRLDASNCKSTPEAYKERESIYANSQLIKVSDASTNDGNVYISNNPDVEVNIFEMPPKPPVQVFDARFANNAKLSNSDESILNVQGVEYPLNLEIDYASSNLEFSDVLTGEIFGTVKKGESKTIEINGTTTGAIKINSSNPELTSDVRVYPNPVNDFMAVEFANPVDGDITISLYSMVGLNVGTLYSGYQNTGNVNIPVDNNTFDFNSLAEGRYVLRIETAQGELTAMVNIVRN